MIRDRVREEIAKRLTTHGAPMSAEDVADDILSIKELAVVDRDAKFPKLSFSEETPNIRFGYQLAQQDMKDLGWVQEEK